MHALSLVVAIGGEGNRHGWRSARSVHDGDDFAGMHVHCCGKSV